MARAIDADKAIEVAQIKYNDWNLAMAAADGRREINLCFKKQELFKAVKAVLDCVPTLTPPNEPLTLDELLKMDGEPVYVVFRPDISGERSQSWALVNVDEKYGEVYLVDSIPGASCYYDEIWADLEGIYRRPPEGADNA